MAQAVGAVGLGSSLAGGLLSAQGAMAGGEAAQRMYNYRAQVAMINSQIDQQNADYELNKGEIQVQQYGMKSAQQQGQIRASQGASGIDVNSGSTKDVQTSQRLVSNMDMAQIRSNAAKVAYDYRTQSTYDQSQAGLDVMAGEDAMTEGRYKAAGSLISTAGNVSSKWLAGQQSGLWG